MATKKDRLVAKAAATTRRPRPATLLEADYQKQGYRVVAVSLYTPEAEWVDRVTKDLQRAGNSKANRSLVIRGVIQRAQEELAEKSPEEILHYFTERQVKRTRAS